MERLPIEIKQLKGTYKKSREFKTGGVHFTPVTSVPDPPEHLGPVGATEWRTICKFLIEQDRLEVPYMAQVEAYCRAYEMVVELSKVLKKEGYLSTITNKGGHTYQVPHPAVKMIGQAGGMMKGFAKSFGIDFSSRLKITVPKKEEKPKDPFELAVEDSERKAKLKASKVAR